MGEKGGKKSHVACEEENEGKIMENEENRGLIDKKAFEDHLESFLLPLVSEFLELSHYSLSLTLGHLDFFWRTSAFDQERKRRKRGSKDQARKSRIKKIQ